MGKLKDRLHTDLTAAMRARDEVRTGTIRMALTAITTAEVAGQEAKELTDDDVIAVLTKESKKRREAATAYRDAGHENRAANEEAEARVLADYLPAALSEVELAALVDAAIAETGATSPREMGQVMKVLKPQVTGRADGAAVAAAVKARLMG
jgi:uncharacterized protein YqeY